MEYSVRTAIIEDASSLAHIIVESWRAAYMEIIPKDEISKYLDIQKRKSQFERYISHGEIVLIGLHNNIPCGLAFGNKENDEGLEKCGSIYSLYIMPEYWGSGIASKLMDNILEILKNQGCKKASLWVFEDNQRAINFYEKSGFYFDGSKKYSHFSNSPVERRYIKEIN